MIDGSVEWLAQLWFSYNFFSYFFFFSAAAATLWQILQVSLFSGNLKSRAVGGCVAVIAGLLHILFLGFVLGCGGVVWLYAIYTKRRMPEAAREQRPLPVARWHGGTVVRWFKRWCGWHWELGALVKAPLPAQFVNLRKKSNHCCKIVS